MAGGLRVFATFSLAVSIFFFASGFLLSRSELDSLSDSNSPFEQDAVDPVFQKLVVVIVDALRWDWARTRLPKTIVAARTLSRFVSVEFRSDPPTTTAQRLKGLTTGSLPTFIDVSRNFGSPAISEDNWVDQLKRAGKKMVVMGDDTWDSLFPGRFDRKFLFPSFNVRDLDTVDNGVLAHFDREFSNSSSWDVLIAHFLGLDHAGHTFGRDTIQATQKLAQMDEFLSGLIPRIRDDTLLVILGDHGMTASGNHGGASEDELSCGLILVSPRLVHDVGLSSRPVPQIDLVPTLSLLMGVPIPFANLGHVMKEVFSPGDYDKAVRQNVWQVRRYISAYSELHKLAFPAHELRRLALLKGQEYLQAAAGMCRDVWATFDVFSMCVGIAGQLLCVGLWFASSSRVVGAILLGLMVGPLAVLIVGTLLAWSSSSAMLFGAGALLGPLTMAALTSSSFVLPEQWFGLALIGLHCLSLLSNSFIEAEGAVNSFLLVSALLFGLARALKRERPQWMWLLAVSFVAANFSSLWVAVVLSLVFLAQSKGQALLYIGVFAFLALEPWHASEVILRLWLPRCLVAMSLLIGVISGKYFDFVLVPVLFLVMGPKGACALAVLLVQRQSIASLDEAAWLMVFCARACFFNAGHVSQFSAIQFESGFLGWDEPPLVVSGVLVVLNTLAPFLLVPTSWSGAFVASQCVISAFCFFARRHLMVWRVFAPKFVFESAMTIVVVFKALIVAK
jgi:hypothetical protein